MIRLADRIPARGSALVKEVMVISGKKRKAVPGWYVCASCKEEYDVKSERDDECYPDHDEDYHGPMDAEENRAGTYLGLL